MPVEIGNTSSWPSWGRFGLPSSGGPRVVAGGVDNVDHTDRSRREKVLNLVCVLVVLVAVLRVGFFAFVGDPGRAAWFGCVAALASVVRVTASHVQMSVRGNAIIVALLLTVVMEVHFRGGIGTPVATGVAIVPLLATMLLGRNIGLFWLAGVLLAIGGIALYEARVTDLIDQVPAVYLFPTNLFLSLFLPSMIFAIGFVFDWVNQASRETIALTIRSKIEAEQVAAMALADRMTTMGLLAAGVGHEINNPLTYVAGNLEILEETLAEVETDPETRESIAELIEDIRVGSQRIQQISRDLRVFAQSKPTGVSQSLLACDVVDSALALVTHELRHHATTHTSIDSEIVIRGDETGLVQILVNLLVNAVNAVQLVARPGHISVRLFEEDGEAVFEVEDNGSGVDQQHLSEIFRPFFTTRELGGGTGLGLAISRAIAQEHGGSLQHRSAPESGAVFRLSVPRHLGTADAVGTKGVELPVVRPMRILVIDDEPAVCRMLASILGDHDVVTADGGRRALEMLSADETFEVILCDLMMPEVDGVAVYEWVCQHKPELVSTFVVMTGGASSAGALRFVRSGSVAVLDKPIDRRCLFEQLRLCSLLLEA